MKNIQILSISIKVIEKTSLYILLHEDGTINRQGFGNFDFNTNFCLGIIETKIILNELSKLLDSELESKFNNDYDLPNKKGMPCSMEIIFESENKISKINFNYGSESVGPPEEVYKLVLKAIELTDSWYNQNNIQKKKWWKLWK